MAQSTTVATLLSRNKDYSTAHHHPPPTMADMRSSKEAPPRVLIISCLDPRANPERFLQLGPASREALIMRNLGGRAGKCLNDIVALDSLVGLEGVMVVHHTDCGASFYTNKMIQGKIKARLPQDQAVDELDFGAIESPEKSLGDDVKVLRDSPYIRPELAEKTFGYVFDIKTGELQRMDG